MTPRDERQTEAVASRGEHPFQTMGAETRLVAKGDWMVADNSPRFQHEHAAVAPVGDSGTQQGRRTLTRAVLLRSQLWFHRPASSKGLGGSLHAGVPLGTPV